MRNYFKSLKLSVTADQNEISRALGPDSATVQALSEKQRLDANGILLNENRLKVYANTVALYEAMHQAQRRLEDSATLDTHQWDMRLKDFDNLDEGPMGDLYSEL